MSKKKGMEGSRSNSLSSSWEGGEDGAGGDRQRLL